MDAMFNKQSATGQTMKKRQLKKTNAETVLKQKYDETQRKMLLMNVDKKKGKKSRTKSSSKTTNIVEIYEEESGQAQPSGQLKKNLLSGTIDQAGMLLHQMSLKGVKVNNSDFLMSKFGVSSSMPKIDSVQNSSR